MHSSRFLSRSSCNWSCRCFSAFSSSVGSGAVPQNGEKSNRPLGVGLWLELVSVPAWALAEHWGSVPVLVLVHHETRQRSRLRVEQVHGSAAGQ